MSDTTPQPRAPAPPPHTGYIGLTRARGDAPPVQGALPGIEVNSVDISYLMELSGNPFGNCALVMRDGRYIVVEETIDVILAALPLRF